MNSSGYDSFLRFSGSLHCVPHTELFRGCTEYTLQLFAK
jgi:hypothetical protein